MNELTFMCVEKIHSTGLIKKIKTLWENHVNNPLCLFCAVETSITISNNWFVK